MKTLLNTDFLVEKLKILNPEKIFLFGSAAKGNMGPDSDIDVLIIKKTKKKPADRVKEVLDLVWGHVPQIEPQILTPDEYQKAIADNRFFIIREVLHFGKLIYEKKS